MISLKSVAGNDNEEDDSFTLWQYIVIATLSGWSRPPHEVSTSMREDMGLDGPRERLTSSPTAGRALEQVAISCPAHIWLQKAVDGCSDNAVQSSPYVDRQLELQLYRFRRPSNTKSGCGSHSR